MKMKRWIALVLALILTMSLMSTPAALAEETSDDTTEESGTADDEESTDGSEDEDGSEDADDTGSTDESTDGSDADGTEDDGTADDDSEDSEDSDTLSYDLSEAKVTLSASSLTYNGAAQRPSVTVVLDDVTLTENTDYTVTCSNNTNVGTASMVISGIGDYTGEASASFKITQKSISGATVTISASSYAYTGSAIKPTPTVKLSLNGSTKTLSSSSDYTVSYSSNTSIGTATMKVTGKGNFTGTVSKTFKIIPKATSLKSLTKLSGGFTAKWSKVTNCTGYQIQYATNSSFTKNVGTETVSGKSTVKTSIGLLTGSKKYYVRIRSYKTVSGTKYYSAWSSTKSVKTKARVTVFAGDSVMTGMSKSSYNGIKYVNITGTEKVVAYKGLNTLTFQTKSCFSGKTGLEKIIAYQPYRVYIMIGMNEVSWRSVSTTISDYQDLIEEIQAECPATDIVLLAVSPVSKSKAASSTGFKKISTLNKKIKKLASKCGVKYYDYTSSFKSSSGYLLSKYNGGDGIHWNLAGYKKFASLISKYDKKLEN